MCNSFYKIDNDTTQNVVQIELHTDEEMFNSDEESDIFDAGSMELKEIYYRNMTISHYNAQSDMVSELINEPAHVYGKFRKQSHSSNRYCNECMNLSFTTYEYHAVYDNILELHNDINSCILGKELNILYGRYFCTVCNLFLFHVEFAEEMNCDTCKLEMEEEDAKELYNKTHISYILQVNDE